MNRKLLLLSSHDTDRLFICSQVNHSLTHSENGSKICCSGYSRLLQSTDLKHFIDLHSFFILACWKIRSLGLLFSNIALWVFASNAFLKHYKFHIKNPLLFISGGLQLFSGMILEGCVEVCSSSVGNNILFLCLTAIESSEQMLFYHNRL